MSRVLLDTDTLSEIIKGRDSTNTSATTPHHRKLLPDNDKLRIMNCLIKTAEDGQILFWDIWEDGKFVVTHFGVVGEEGEEEEWELQKKKDRQELMADMSEKKEAEGYIELDAEILRELVIQYRVEGKGTPADLEKGNAIVEMLEESLGETGNGHADETEMAPGKMDIVCYVIKPEAAAATILKALEDKEWAEGVTIAVLDEETDEYQVLHPEGGEYLS